MTLASVCKTFQKIAEEITLTKFAHMCGASGVGYKRFVNTKEWTVFPSACLTNFGDFLSNLTNLEKLRIPGDIHLSKLTNLTNLKVRSASLTTLMTLSKLHSLTVWEPSSSDQLSQLLKLPDLRKFNYFDIHSSDFDLIFNFTNLTALSWLGSDNTFVSEASEKRLSTLTNLHSLHLEVAVKELDNITTLTQLRRLILVCNDIPPEYFLKFPKLEMISVIGYDPKFSLLTNLRAMSLQADPHIYQRTKSIELQSLTRLEKLEIAMPVKREILLPSSLRVLDLTGGIKSVTQIQDLSKFTKLKSLTLVVTEDPYRDYKDVITRFTNLTLLSVPGHPIPYKLSKKFPNLRILEHAGENGTWSSKLAQHGILEIR